MIGKRLIGTSDSLRLNLTHVGRTDKGMDNTMTHRIWYKPARTLLAATALIFFAVSTARAELLIRITEGADSAIPVAVVPFAESGQMPAGDKVSSIVQALSLIHI